MEQTTQKNQEADDHTADNADSQGLPVDVLVEILSRTSLEFVGRCRLVSKEFKKITYDRSFTQLLRERNKTVSIGFFIQSNKSRVDAERNPNINPSRPLVLTFVSASVPVTVLATSKAGILLCTKLINGALEYYICKPTTAQWQQIPAPEKLCPSSIEHYGMTVSGSRPLRYKIVRLSGPCGTDSNWTRFEIFDSKTMEWKQQMINLPCCEKILYGRHVQSLGGNLYWLMPPHTVLELNLEEEHFQVFSLPRRWVGLRIKVLLEYEGQLAVIFMAWSNRYFMELWVLNSTSTNMNRSWVRIKKVYLEDLMYITGRACDYDVEPVACYNSDVVVFLDARSSRLIFYHLQDYYSSIICPLSEQCWLPFDIFPFQSDSEHVDFQ